MHSFVTSKNVKWCHLIWPTLYTHIYSYIYTYFNKLLFVLVMEVKLRVVITHGSHGMY